MTNAPITSIDLKLEAERLVSRYGEKAPQIIIDRAVTLVRDKRLDPGGRFEHLQALSDAVMERLGGHPADMGNGRR